MVGLIWMENSDVERQRSPLVQNGDAVASAGAMLMIDHDLVGILAIRVIGKTVNVADHSSSPWIADGSWINHPFWQVFV